MSTLETMAKAYIGFLIKCETAEEVANITPGPEDISAMRAAVESLKAPSHAVLLAGQGVTPGAFSAMIEAILDGK